MLHAKSSEDWGDIGFLTETDSGTNYIAVDLNAEELVCRPEVRDPIYLRELWLGLDHGFGGGIRTWHGDIVDM